jgi:hypothetical protein
VTTDWKLERTFTLFDWIGTAATVLGLALVALWPMAVAPDLRAALAETGGEVPFATRLALTAWFVPAIAAAAAALLVLGILLRASVGRRRVFIGASFVLVLAAQSFLRWASAVLLAKQSP